MGRLETTKQEPAAIDTGRTLIFNRIPHLCFSRDKLLFYLFQRDAALREDATWHPFALELAYHLNFHYLLLYGAFDHAALFVNGVLGLPEKKVGAKDEAFRKKLKSVSPSLHAIFADTATTEFLNQLGALRNYTAHRGSINPSKLVQKREKEPTDEEIDAYLHESGHDTWLLDFPEGPQRTNFRVILRSTARSDLLGKNPIDHDVVLVEIDKKWCLVHPLTDVTRNLRRTLCFLRRVFDECIKILT
jgi:hypothetical protein